MVTIRPERTEDHAAVHAVHEAAFGRPDEADLVDRLRPVTLPALSLVAEAEGRVVGHILFSAVTVGHEALPGALGLAPLAVLPVFQRRGIGAALVRSGLGACRRTGHGVVVVLGDPAYYSRFGFGPAGARGLRCAYDVLADAFMVMELSEGALRGRTGTVGYLPEFGGL